MQPANYVYCPSCFTTSPEPCDRCPSCGRDFRPAPAGSSVKRESQWAVAALAALILIPAVAGLTWRGVGTRPASARKPKPSTPALGSIRCQDGSHVNSSDWKTACAQNGGVAYISPPGAQPSPMAGFTFNGDYVPMGQSPAPGETKPPAPEATPADSPPPFPAADLAGARETPEAQESEVDLYTSILGSDEKGLASGEYLEHYWSEKYPPTTTYGETKLWIRSVVSKGKREAYIRELREGGVGYDASKFYYARTLFEFRCKARTLRVSHFLDYDLNGRVLDRQNPYAEWHDAVPGSVGESLLNFACSYQSTTPLASLPSATDPLRSPALSPEVPGANAAPARSPAAAYTYTAPLYAPTPYVRPTPSYSPGVAENGSYYGETSPATGRPKTVHIEGYYRRDGTYVRGHYRSAPRRR